MNFPTLSLLGLPSPFPTLSYKNPSLKYTIYILLKSGH